MGTSHEIYRDVEGWMFDADLLFLRACAHSTESLGGLILEIGSFCGLSTAILTENGAKVVCVDPFVGGEDLPFRDTLPDFEYNMKRLGRFEQVTVCRMTSDQFFYYQQNPDQRPPALKPDWEGPFRLIFVDGSHEHEQVLRDFRNVWSVLEPGGILVSDDINWGDTRPVYFAAIRSGLPFANIPGTKMAAARKPS